MREEIVLIGPIGTGKSTLGKLLAHKLSVPQVAVDQLRFDLYKRIGYDEAHAHRLRTEQGFIALARYWKPFEAYAVEQILAEHSNCVIDFGAGHSVYDEAALFERVRTALEPYRNVILVLPCPDLDESVQILKSRMGEIADGGVDFHEYFTKHRCNHELAKAVVYTKGRTPEETRDEIIQLTQQA